MLGGEFENRQGCWVLELEVFVDRRGIALFSNPVNIVASVWGKSKPAESNRTEAVCAKLMFYSRDASDKTEDAIFREGNMEEEKPLPAVEVATVEADDDV